MFVLFPCYSNMETEGKLVTNRIHVTLLIGREREKEREDGGQLFSKVNREKKNISEKSDTDRRTHSLCPPQSWTHMFSAPSTKRLKPTAGKSYASRRKWRLQMSAAKCYKAWSPKLKPQHSSAEATDLLRGRASQLLTRRMIPSSNPSLPVQTRIEPPPATSFRIYGRCACCCWREQDDSGFDAGMCSWCQVKIEILSVTATAQGTDNFPENLRTGDEIRLHAEPTVPVNLCGCSYIVICPSCTGRSLAKKEKFHIDEVVVEAGGCPSSPGWTRFNQTF